MKYYFPLAKGTSINEAVVKRLQSGDWSFGCAGRHHGNGTKECPYRLHHHHDDFCNTPTTDELKAAGIDPANFKSRRR